VCVYVGVCGCGSGCVGGCVGQFGVGFGGIRVQQVALWCVCVCLCGWVSVGGVVGVWDSLEWVWGE